MSYPRTLDAQGAVYFDGDSPVPQPVQIEVTARTGDLVMTAPEGLRVVWPMAEVRQQPDVAVRGMSVLRWTGDPVARLVCPTTAVLAELPAPKRRAPPKGRGRLLGWAVAAVAAVALQIFVLVPLLADNLAGFIPARGERALGEATLGHIREALGDTDLNPLRTCTSPDGDAALAELVTRLSGDAAFEDVVTVSVLDHEMINAFALPGGFVVLFRGLIDAANGPDEVAAVLAHEIGHVVSRDPTRHALRSAGSIGVLGLLLGDFAGGAAVLVLTERLISAQYSQAAEIGADAFAHDVLARANISPGALGQMFATLRDAHGDSDGVTSHFVSHPRLGDRIAAAQAQVDAQADYSASMDPAAWKALQDICEAG